MIDSEKEEKLRGELRSSVVPYFIFGKPEMSLGRWLSLFVALFYIISAIISEGFVGLFIVFFLVIPILCIWYGEEMGVVSLRLTKTTPGLLVVIGGWAILLFPFWLPLLVKFIEWLK
jgi:hypothetical protein